jgi:hypothetical protein
MICKVCGTECGMTDEEKGNEKRNENLLRSENLALTLANKLFTEQYGENVRAMARLEKKVDAIHDDIRREQLRKAAMAAGDRIKSLEAKLAESEEAMSRAKDSAAYHAAPFKVGESVLKIGDYELPGKIRAIFSTSKGYIRYVVEHSPGFLHIYSEKNLSKVGS